ncbi:MAG TPA: hypothetical protein VGB98_06130 [Pyrinomonadaceae bacterium]|jgi:hypothetical protein
MITATFTVETTPLERLALERAAALVGAPSVEQLLLAYVRINLDAAVADYMQATIPSAQIEAMRGTPVNRISAAGDAAGGD